MSIAALKKAMAAEVARTPTQYVNQLAVLQNDPGTWMYPKPGRNVQVWRNGVLQQFGVDYTLNLAQASIYTVEVWAETDWVVVNYLY